jgi:dihydrofolate reductase
VGSLIYTAIASLDGYIEDASGRFDWSAPDAEVHAFVNDLERGVGTQLLGRRLYEVLKVWETLDEPEEVMQDFARIWRAADKIVYSTTLQEVSTARTRIEREFDPDAVRRLKSDTERDISIGGAELAGEALRAGLVDELQLLASPVVVGGGKPWLPDGLRLDLELTDVRRFGNGVAYLRYRV